LSEEHPPPAAEPGPHSIRTRHTIAVLALSCTIFATAAAAFAWTTVRAHDRAIRAETRATQAESRDRPIAAVLGASDLRTTTTHVSADGTLTIYYSAALDSTVIAANGLDALPAQRTYELWYLDDAGANHPPRPAGTSRFDPAGTGLILARSAGHPSSIAITIEPSVGSSLPTTAPIATVPF
jgi:hypothetical protein